MVIPNKANAGVPPGSGESTIKNPISSFSSSLSVPPKPHSLSFLCSLFPTRNPTKTTNNCSISFIKNQTHRKTNQAPPPESLQTLILLFFPTTSSPLPRTQPKNPIFQ